jgi:hypothetical protein
MKATNIVTRLREHASEGISDFTKCSWDIQEAADEIERLRVLLEVFDAHYICEDCAELSATYLEKCQNPLHQLHEAAWENEQ